MITYSHANVAGVFAFAALTLAGPHGAHADCTAEWAEEVGLSADFVPHVRDFVVFDDGTGEALYASGLINDGPPDDNAGAVRFNGETWEPLRTQDPDGVASAIHLEVFQGELYGAGGYRIFDPVDGEYKWYRVARWDTSLEDWLPVSDAIPQFFTVFTGDSMVAFDGSLYIGGRHNASQGIGPDRLSRFDGNDWGPPTAPLPSSLFFSDVRDLIVYDGALYASFGGLFDPGMVYRLEAGADEWEQIGDTVPTFSRMAIFQGELYIAGTNSQFFPAVTDHVFRLVDGPGGYEWQPIPSESNYEFTFIEVFAGVNDGSGEALYIGGEIVDIGGAEDVNGIAKWDGNSWSSLAGGLLDEDEDWWDTRVHALQQFNDGSGPALWVGGEFVYAATADGLIDSPGIARWGCEPQPVDPALSTVVTAESAISSFAGTTRITVTPRNAAGDLLDPGQDVVLSIDAGTLLGSVSDQGDGTYRQYLEGDGSVGTEVRAAVNGIDLDETPFVAFVPVEPSLSSIALSIDQTFLGGTAEIVVTLVDDAGVPVGSGFDVQITTTLGQLVGTLTDNGDGTYSQTIVPDITGTASITATVDGMALNTSAALSVLDPANIGSIIGHDNDGNPIGYLSIQAAIDDAADGTTIFIAPGTYNETILLDNANGLIVEGLSALEPVVIQGVVVSDSNDVSLRYLTIDPNDANQPRNAVEMRGGPRASDGVEIIGSTIVNARHNGVSVDRGNNNVHIIDSVIANNGRYGIDIGRDGEGHLILNSTVADNNRTGVEIDRNVEVTLQHNVISGNGFFFNVPNPNGHGLSRARHGANGNPEQVTLIQNTFANNNGRVQNNRSDSDIRNYDQIIDSTDDQSPYTD